MIYKKDYFLLPFFLLFSILANSQTTIFELRSKADEVFLTRIGEDDEASSAELAQNLKDDFNANTGSWATTDLTDLDDKNCDSSDTDKSWQPIDWLENIRQMAEGVNFVNISDPIQQMEEIEEIETAIIAALNDWYSVTVPANTNCPACTGSDENPVTTLPYCCDNWWWNQIGKQFELQRIAILSWDILYADHLATNDNPDLLDNTLLERIIVDLPSTVENINTPAQNDFHTGANKTELASSMIIKGILRGGIEATETGGLALVNEGKLAMGCAMDFAPEGMQADYSFHQHGALLYSGGYGHSFIEIISTFGAMLQGTDYAFADDRRGRFYSYILEGYRWMLRGYTTDYSAIGRYISREQESHSLKVSSDFLDLTVDMLESDDPDIEDDLTYIYMHDDLNSSNDNWQDFDILGESKHFWKSDYVVHQMPGVVDESTGYLSSVKMCSQRTIGIESINQENKRGYWLPYGCTFLYKRGDEYQNIFPYWDWENVPGVTNPAIWLTPEDSDEPESTTQLSNFVGSAGNDQYSVTTMDLNKDYDINNNNGSPDIKNIKAKKSWFHFGGEIIGLGADIQDESGLDVYTTIDQSHYAGAHTKDDNNTEWIQHNDIAYIFPSYPENPNGSTYMLTTGNQQGSWYEIDSGGETDIELGNVFKAWINHGQPTETDPADYYYIIAPGQDAAIYASNNPITLLENTEFVQAVKKVEPTGEILGGIVYYPKANFTYTPVNLQNGLILSTSHPCALLYDEVNGQVCISSPNRANSSITLRIESDGGVSTPQEEVFAIIIDESEAPTTCIDISDFSSGITTSLGNVSAHCGTVGIQNVEITPIGALTSSAGNYTVSTLSGNSFTLDPFKDDNYLNGVGAKDVIGISQHILGSIYMLDTPYELIAADVDKSGTINFDDLFLIQQLILGNISSFPAVDSWEFVTESHVFSNLLNPFGNTANPWPFPQTASTASISNPPDIDFIGIKMGDVNCNSSTTGIIDDAPQVIIVVEDKTVVKGEKVDIPFRVTNFSNVEAYQLGIEFNSDVLEKQSINPGDLNGGAEPDNFGLTEVGNGKIKTLWIYNDASDPSITAVDTSLVDSSSIFEISFKAKIDFTRSSSDYKLSDLLNLNDEVLVNKAISEKGTHQIKLKFVEEGYFEKVAKSNLLLSPIKCFPNPTKEQINFQLNLRTESDIQLQIFDPIGKLITERKLSLPAGVQTIDLKNLNEWEDGLYYYTIRIGEEMESGKFVKQ